MTKDILLLYFNGYPQATTVMEHIESFEKYSEFNVQPVNVHKKNYFQSIKANDYKAIVMHYTMFAMDFYYLDYNLSDYLRKAEARKICFFQDEYFNCQKRFAFLNDYEVDAVYTLVDPSGFRATYQKYTSVPFLQYTIPGFISDRLLEISETVVAENLSRDVDISYRGRQIDFAWGVAGQEKHLIADEFKQHAEGLDLVMDIETHESKRIYGDEWYWFIAGSKAVLGVEAGVSIFDVDDVVRTGIEKLRRDNPDVSNEVLFKTVMSHREDNIFYRTISPRHFEAAALGTCQILYKGLYSGIMDPWVHYIPLEKNFSNFKEVMDAFKDDSVREEIAVNARKDLVDSGRYHYREFIRQFDMDLRLLGVR